MSHGTSKLPIWVALVGSGLAGVLVATQSRVNGGLSQQLTNGYVAAATSFASGLVIMCVVVAMSPRARRGLGSLRGHLASRRLPLWSLLGGAGGSMFVLAQGLVAPLTGLALFTVGIVAGQVLGGLVLDRVGLGPGGRIDPTLSRTVGSLLAVIAVIVAVASSLSALHYVWLVIFPFLVGAMVSAQSMANGLVRAAAQSAVASTFINFVGGAAILITVAAISVSTTGWPTTWPSSPWYYIGGVLGTIFIAIAAMLVRTAGVLLLSMSNVAGQLIAAVAFEASIPLADGLTPGLIAGSAIALIAVTVAALPRRQ